MEDKLKAFLQDIQGKLSEAIAMCGAEESEEGEETAYEPDDMPDDKALRKEKLKLKLKKELAA